MSFASAVSRPIGSAKHLVTGLRSVLGFLVLAGHIGEPLAVAVPAVAHWGAGGLPRALSPDAVAALVASCDRETLGGLRDRAILSCWPGWGCGPARSPRWSWTTSTGGPGELVVRGKGPRRERLPLPVDVGEALAAYLRDGRPRARVPEGVRAARTPRSRGLTAPACHVGRLPRVPRAGLPRAGAHRLRHTRRHRDAAPAARRLTEIGQVLRHRSPADHRDLRQGRPGRRCARWPGPGRGVRHDRDPRSDRRLPGGAPRARATSSSGHGWLLAELRRLPGARRRGDDHHRARAGLGHAARATRIRTWWAARLRVVRGFARHLHAFDPATEIPPAGLLPGRTGGATPYLYSDAEIARADGRRRRRCGPRCARPPTGR